MTERHGQTELAECDVIIVLGGDGQMLHALRQNLDHGKDLYGMNCGRVGFLMNDYEADNLEAHITAATRARIHPLRMTATDKAGTPTVRLPLMRYHYCGKPMRRRISPLPSMGRLRWTSSFAMGLFYQPRKAQLPIIYQLMALFYQFALIY